MPSPVWYYVKDGRSFGPVLGSELRRLARSGELQQGDAVWKEGMHRSVAAGSVRGLFSRDGVKSASHASTPLGVWIVGQSGDNTPSPSESATVPSLSQISRPRFPRWRFPQFSWQGFIWLLLTAALGVVLYLGRLSGNRPLNSPPQQKVTVVERAAPEVPQAVPEGAPEAQPELAGKELQAAAPGLEKLGWHRGECLLCRMKRTGRERADYSDRHGFGFCERCGEPARHYARLSAESRRGLPTDVQTHDKAKEYLQLVNKYYPSPPHAPFLMVFAMWGDDAKWEQNWQRMSVILGK